MPKNGAGTVRVKKKFPNTVRSVSVAFYKKGEKTVISVPCNGPFRFEIFAESSVLCGRLRRCDLFSGLGLTLAIILGVIPRQVHGQRSVATCANAVIRGEFHRQRSIGFTVQLSAVCSFDKEA